MVEIDTIRDRLSQFCAMNSIKKAMIQILERGTDSTDTINIPLLDSRYYIEIKVDDNNFDEYIDTLNNAYFPKYVDGILHFSEGVLEIPVDPMNHIGCIDTITNKQNQEIKLGNTKHIISYDYPSENLRSIRNIINGNGGLRYETYISNLKDIDDSCKIHAIKITNIDINDPSVIKIIKMLNFISYNDYMSIPFITLKDRSFFEKPINISRVDIPTNVDSQLIDLWNRAIPNTNNPCEYYLSLFRIIENAAIRCNRDEVYEMIRNERINFETNKISFTNKLSEQLKKEGNHLEVINSLLSVLDIQDEAFKIIKDNTGSIPNEKREYNDISIKPKNDYYSKKNKQKLINESFRIICNIRNILTHGGMDSKKGKYFTLSEDVMYFLEPWIKVLYAIALKVTTSFNTSDLATRGGFNSIGTFDISKKEEILDRDGLVTCKKCKQTRYYKKGMKVIDCLCGNSEFEF